MTVTYVLFVLYHHSLKIETSLICEYFNNLSGIIINNNCKHQYIYNNVPTLCISYGIFNKFFIDTQTK